MTTRPRALLSAIVIGALTGRGGAAAAPAPPLAAAPVTEAASSPTPASGRLRCLDKRAGNVLREALRYSPTVRGLAARIEDSDLIVLLQIVMLPGNMVGATKLMTSVPGARYVSVTLDPRGLPQDMLGRLGHELRHVVEIADAPDVADEAGMQALFKRIGWKAGRANTYETEAAIETGRRVASEAWERPIRLVGDVARAR